MERRNRHSTRMQGFDYSTSGSYFVTICAHNRDMLFEDPVLESIAENQWSSLPDRFPSVTTDVFVVMPNHIHGVLWLENAVGAPLAGALTRRNADTKSDSRTTDRPRAGASPAPTLGTVIGTYKSLVVTDWLRWIKANKPGRSGRVWQRNYWDRVIRNEDELNRIRQYIAFNPIAWQFDHENPNRVRNADYEKTWFSIEKFL